MNELTRGRHMMKRSLLWPHAVPSITRFLKVEELLLQHERRPFSNKTELVDEAKVEATGRLEFDLNVRHHGNIRTEKVPYRPPFAWLGGHYQGPLGYQKQRATAEEFSADPQTHDQPHQTGTPHGP